ncbi:Chemotaxis protein cheA [Candidatus Magnetomorum sp. HK-1]|nr:Chemotaxis protein cheA [Candidatus Magnetomorum sp. HK-1]
MIVDNTFIEEYLIEAKEHIDEIENDVLILEGIQNNPDFNLIDKIFRSIHTIKGGAGFLKLKKINDLCHHFESLLNLLRSKKIQLSYEHIEILLSGVDRFKIMLNDIKQADKIDIQDLTDLCLDLSNCKKQENKTIISGETNQTNFKSDSDILSIKDLNLKSDKVENINQYRFHIDCNELYKSYKVTPVDLIYDFNSMGKILDVYFESNIKDLSECFENKPLLLYIHYATTLQADILSLIFHISKDSINIIQTQTQTQTQATSKEALSSKNDLQCQEVCIVSQQQIKKTKSKKINISNNKFKKSQTRIFKEEKKLSIRIGLDILDNLMNFVGELVLVRNKFLMEVTKADHRFYEIFQELDIVTSDVQECAMLMRMQPIDRIFSKIPRMVRDLSKLFNKNIQLSISGNNVELDQNIIESISDPIMHIIRNCCDHGIESTSERLELGKSQKGEIQINAFHRGGRINIEISDNGKGINIQEIKEKALALNIKTEEELKQMENSELLPIIMTPGLTTAKKTTDISGRGVGMDVVKTSIEQIGGIIEIDSELHIGTTFMLSLPLTLTIIPCLIVVSDNEKYAIPQSNLNELVRLYENEIYTEIKQHDDQEVYLLRDKVLPIIRLNEVLKRRQVFKKSTILRITKKYKKIAKNNFHKNKLNEQILTFAVVKFGVKMFGIIIDEIRGTKELVVNPMLKTFSPLKIYSGTTILGNGEVALVLDIESIAKHTKLDFNKIKSTFALRESDTLSAYIQRALIFKIGKKELFAVPLIMVNKLIPIKKDSIGVIGNDTQKEYITIQEETFLIVRLHELIDISPCIDDTNLFILIPKNSKIRFGLLFSQLKGVVDMPLSLDEENYKIDVVLGSSIINNKLTLFLNIDAIVNKIESLWLETTPLLLQNVSSKNKNVLLVEDTHFFRKLAQGFLVNEGFTVHTACNGVEGLKILETIKCDLIISDIEMPEMNGWEFMKKVRSSQAFSHIPAIALTSLNSEKDRNKSKVVGFDIHEIKINRENLIACVNKLISEKEFTNK